MESTAEEEFLGSIRSNSAALLVEEARTTAKTPLPSALRAYIPQYVEDSGTYKLLLNIGGDWVQRTGGNFDDHKGLAHRLYDMSVVNNMPIHMPYILGCLWRQNTETN